MGNLCGSPNDSRGYENDAQRDTITLWADYFSPQSRAMIAILDYCKIPYKIEAIDTQCGDIREDSIYYTISLPSQEASAVAAS